MEKWFPLLMSFTLGNLPINNLSFFSMLPKAEGNEDNNPLPLALAFELLQRYSYAAPLAAFGEKMLYS
jgi:hypothetical protein